MVRFAHILVIACLASIAPRAGAQEYPALTTTIRPDHPLLLFAAQPVSIGGAATAAEQLSAQWAQLPDTLRPFAVLELFVPGADPTARRDTLRALLTHLQAANIPVTLRIVEEGQPALPLALVEPLLQEFSIVRGIEAAGLAFNEYISFGGDPSLEWSASTRWLVNAIDLAARYGRFITLHLDELHWLRIMANTQCARLYESIRRHHEYVIPLNRHRPPHNLARMGALMGAWLEGAVDHWGVEVRSDWYHAARFIAPGSYGAHRGEDRPPLYPAHAMLLNGFMTGAEVYAFALPEDLWYAAHPAQWTTVIRPALERAIDRGHIAARAAVAERARVAYQLATARNPQEFHLNLHDLDPVYDHGLFMHAVYGVERAGQVPELVLNTGRYYWIPILSPHAPEAALGQYDYVARPRAASSVQEWKALVDTYYSAEGEGTAFQCAIGGTTYVMNTLENLYEDQTFRLRSVATPVQGLTTRVADDGILLSWPQREGDVRYTVLRRDWPDGAFEALSNEVDIPQFLDAAPVHGKPAAYAVTAITNEKTTFAGALGLGEYLVVDRNRSPLIEEVVVEPPGEPFTVTPVARYVRYDGARLWWPNTAALPEDQAIVARAIADTMVEWDRAVQSESLDEAMLVYSADYRDPSGSRTDCVRSAYQWFFNRYTACRMDRQIRAWDFARWNDARTIDTRVYVRFFGVAVSDPTGRFADQAAWFPATPTGEVLLTWRQEDDRWRIVATDPALPSFEDILLFSNGPFDAVFTGTD